MTEEANNRLTRPFTANDSCPDLTKSIILSARTIVVVTVAALSILTMLPCEVFWTDKISDIVAMVATAMMILGGIFQLIHFIEHKMGTKQFDNIPMRSTLS